MKHIKTIYFEESGLIYFSCNTGVRGSNISAIACTDSRFKKEIIHRNWYLNGCGYPCTGGGNIRTFLHSLVMGPLPDDKVIDHINQNPLDGRSKNLRIVNKSHNAFNSKTPMNNTSGKKGVSYNKEKGMFESYVTLRQKRYRLGMYKTLNEAMAARKSIEMFLAKYEDIKF